MAKAKRKNSLQRNHSVRELRPVLIVACEGKTEVEFLKQIRQHRRIAAAQVVFVGQAGDPLAVVERAVAVRDGYQRKRIEVGACYAVFDRDEHPRFERAVAAAGGAQVKLAISNPCVEIWFIWLRAEQTAHIARGAAQRRCRQLFAGYDHDENPFFQFDDAILSAVDSAEARATSQRVRHASADGRIDANPSSTFGEVVRALLSYPT